jgi:hypothetical protein
LLRSNKDEEGILRLNPKFSGLDYLTDQLESAHEAIVLDVCVPSATHQYSVEYVHAPAYLFHA